MRLLDHLGELRRRLAVVLALNLIAAVILFQYAAVIMEYLFALNPGMELVYISPQELLLVYIQIAFIAAIVLCSPITIYEIWAFVGKGLYRQEKVYVLTSLFFGLLCFAGGVVFSYAAVLPITLEFFVRIATEEVAPMISVQNYADFVNKMLLAFGIVLVIWLGSALFSGVNMGLAPSTFSSPLLFLGLALFTPPFFTGKGTRWGLLPFTTGGVLIVVAALVLAFALNGTVSFSGGGGSDSGGSGSTCPVCGRTYTDSSNKNSIWWSNMCNSCKHDYEAVEDALGGDLGAIFG